MTGCLGDHVQASTDEDQEVRGYTGEVRFLGRSCDGPSVIMSLTRLRQRDVGDEQVRTAEVDEASAGHVELAVVDLGVGRVGQAVGGGEDDLWRRAALDDLDLVGDGL